MAASCSRPPDWRDRAPRSWGDDFYVVRFALPAPSNDVIVPLQLDLRAGPLARPALAGASVGFHAGCGGGDAGGAVLLPPGATAADAQALAAWLAARPGLARVELDAPDPAARPDASAT